MPHGNSAGPNAPRPAQEYSAGDKVCVVRGIFAGAKGVVRRKEPGPRYVLTLEGLSAGVYVALSCEAIDCDEAPLPAEDRGISPRRKSSTLRRKG